MTRQKKEINFDRFVRGLIALSGFVLLYLLIVYLSPVLLPFFIAWLFAYMLYPIVRFFEVKCRLRSRLLSIILTLGLVGGIATAVGMAIVPAFLDEMSHLKVVAHNYVTNDNNEIKQIPQQLQELAKTYLSEEKISEFIQQSNVQEIIQKMVPKVWGLLRSTAGIVISIISSLIGILYFFFLLIDYERYSEGWKKLIPHKNRSTTVQVVGDVERNMNAYFRGQALVALSNCIMFSIGFALLGLPVPVALGIFIGIISFVPYLQLIGFIPATLLAFLHSLETGQNFWLLMGGVCLVYIVVQILQDTIVTPKVMGKIMGLRPAIVLLSLTVWGYMLGVIGLIIALPMTTLLISYYTRYIQQTDPTVQPSDQS
ncbi:MAG: AI-2E family transporter [Alloprevotella sp.]|nr:AI-2E family transporter [Alloprevotella sp.]